jgi:uncharacterized membrane protein
LVEFALLLKPAFWGGLILLIVWAIKRFRPGSSSRPEHDGGDPAMRILEERFACVEIDADEFQRGHEVLRGQR